MFGLFGRNKSKDQLKKRLQMVLVADRAGLAPGARVVTAGAFALRSELAKDELSEAEH